MGDSRLDPIDAYEGVVGGMREPMRLFVKTSAVTEEIPDVRFGQANPQAALVAVDGQLRTAKGDVATALRQFRRDLFGPDGETDLSVERLLRARERLDSTIKAAQDRVIGGVRDQIELRIRLQYSPPRSRDRLLSVSNPIPLDPPDNWPGGILSEGLGASPDRKDQANTVKSVWSRSIGSLVSVANCTRA